MANAANIRIIFGKRKFCKSSSHFVPCSTFWKGVKTYFCIISGRILELM